MAPRLDFHGFHRLHDSIAPRLDDGKRWYSDGRFSDVIFDPREESLRGGSGKWGERGTSGGGLLSLVGKCAFFVSFFAKCL